jgi:hypothetical protein
MVGKKYPPSRGRPRQAKEIPYVPQTRQDCDNEPSLEIVEDVPVIPTGSLQPPGELVCTVEDDPPQDLPKEYAVSATTPNSDQTPMSGRTASSYTWDSSPGTIPRTMIASPSPENLLEPQDWLRVDMEYLNENHYVLQGVGGQGILTSAPRPKLSVIANETGHLSGEHTMRFRQGEMLDRSPPGYLSNLPMFETQLETPSLIEREQQFRGTDASWSAQYPCYVPTSTVDPYAPEAGDYDFSLAVSVGAGLMADDFVLYEMLQSVQPLERERRPRHYLSDTLAQDQEGSLLEHGELGELLSAQVQNGAQRLRFGGRPSGTHLAEDKRKSSNGVRRARACFRCHTFRIPVRSDTLIL